MGTATTQEIGCEIDQCVFYVYQDLLFLYYRFYISMDLSDEKYTLCKLEESINVDFFI